MTSGLANFVVSPGSIALDDLIANTERGIVLGRFSGGAPNQNLDFSGVAKNSFYVEDGKVVHPIAETMIAGNFVTALESIKGISRETIDLGMANYPWLSTGGITVSTK
jgi:PmbA protein